MSPDETKKYIYGSEIQSTFNIGSPVKWVGPGRGGPETVHVYGKVLEFEPSKAFSHTSRVGETYGTEHAKFESRVTYRLEPIGECTKLTLVRNQWPDGDLSYENTAANGWWTLLSSLKTFIETGKPLELTSVTHE